MRIRSVRPDDRPEWLRMRRSLWEDCPDAQHEQEMGEYVQQHELNVFIAEDDESEVCGFLEASIRPWANGCEARPVGYIEGWYVDAAARRKGVGRALVLAAEAWARSRGCTQMGSDALIDNPVSHRAHEALGYEETERIVNFKKDLG